MACRKLILAQIQAPNRVCQWRGISTGLWTGAKQTDLQTETHTGQVINQSANCYAKLSEVECVSRFSKPMITVTFGSRTLHA